MQIALFEPCTYFNNHGWLSGAGAGRRMHMTKTAVTFVESIRDRNLVYSNVAGHVDGRFVMLTGSLTISHVSSAEHPSDIRIPCGSSRRAAFDGLHAHVRSFRVARAALSRSLM
jgi:hypothetical protein